MPPRPHRLLLALTLTACAQTVAPAAPGDAADAPDASADDVAEEPALPPGLARALTITDVAAFQAVRVPLFADGAVVSPRLLPIIAGRSLALRVYVRPEAGYEPVEVDGELTARTAGRTVVVHDRKRIESASRDAQPATLFTFRLPDEAVGPDTALSVRLITRGGGAESDGVADPARFPAAGGGHALRAMDGGPIEVTIVPLRWDVDRSGRVPELAALQLEDLRASLRAMYPVREVRIDVREPVSWARGLLPSGNVDFGAILASLRTLRASDGAPATRYYYGMVTPTDSEGEYCRGRCVLGQAYLPSGPADRLGRVASGVGFGGAEDARTFTHELGHAHGRAHAPCGDVAGADGEFPYENGAVGVWGYDERSRAFVRPTAFDLMGYCRPAWISDYTYGAVWEWVTAVNGVAATRGLAAPAPAPVRHRVLRVGPSLAPEWLDGLDEPPAAGAATLAWRDAAGRVLTRATTESAPLADSAECHVLVPPGPPGARSLDVAVAGASYRVALPAAW